MRTIEDIKKITDRISLSLFGVNFTLIVDTDKAYPKTDFHIMTGQSVNPGRPYIQIMYAAPCTKTGELETWKGRKWQLSDFMTDDEIVKTVYAAFEAAVKHEILEGFKVDGIILFNPHVDYMALLEVSNREVRREQN